MKASVLILTSIFFSTICTAQAPLNKTVYDCDSNSKNIQDVLGTGKALIIAHKGVDCSICKSSAGPLQTWAAANKSKVEVWGAMSYRYNPNSFKPECQKTKDWDSTYAWNDIFAFADSSRSWAASSSPRYYVYSAIDSTIVFQGSSRTVAQDSALNHSTIVVGLNELSAAEQIKVVYNAGQIELKNLPEKTIELFVYNLNGKLIEKRRDFNLSTSINTAGFEKGIYILQLRTKDGFTINKKLFIL